MKRNRECSSSSSPFLLTLSSKINIAVVVLIIFFTSSFVGGDRTNKIYEPIETSFPCFRKLNGTHEVGCASSPSGDVGVVYLVTDEESLNWVVKDGPHSPYVAIIYPSNLTSKVLNKFRSSGRVTGVLVVNSTEELKGLEKFSPDDKCPNRGFGLYVNSTSSHYCEAWNEPGEGLLFENYNFPMFYVQQEEQAKKIVDCYEQFNAPLNGSVVRDWPLCAAQLKAFMLAAVDTPTCIRRSERLTMEQQKERVCDPMGDLNLWCSVVPSNQAEPYKNESVVVIAARLDASSLFEGLARGADSAGTGIATLLAVLNHLSGLKDEIMGSPVVSNVYFVLFHGESFGYIGSSRMVYDMKNGDFPAGIMDVDQNVTAKLNMSNIKYFIEIGQVGLTEERSPFFIHATNDAPEAQKLTNVFLDEAKIINLDVNKPSTSKGFPPSSLQSFLKENTSLPGIFISNHDTKFRNQFYNSLFDNDIHLNYVHTNSSSKSVVTRKVAELAATISNTVMNIIGSRNPVTPNYTLADDLLHCYLETGRCDLFQRVAGNDKMPDAPLDLYVGVNRHYIASTQFTRILMMYFQGRNVSSEKIKTEDDCKAPEAQKNVFYQWINDSCYETTVNISQAVSPAFIIDNYDWKSGEYSTWTESIWQQFSVRIFVKPSRTHEIITLVSGIVVFLASFVIVGWVSNKSDVVFPSRPAGMAC